MNRQQGASTLELALVAPLLLLLALGIVDIGQLLATNIAIKEATQEGLAHAIHEPGDASGITNRVVFAVDEPALEASHVTISCPSSPADHIAVTVTRDLDLITPFISELFGGTVTVSTTSVGEIIAEQPCVAT